MLSISLGTIAKLGPLAKTVICSLVKLVLDTFMTHLLPVSAFD